MVRKNRGIYGFLGPSSVLITYNICPPEIPIICVIHHRYHYVFYLQIVCLGSSMPRAGTALPSATRPPVAARPRHARAKRRPSVSSVFTAEEQAPQSNSASVVERCPPGDGLFGPPGDHKKWKSRYDTATKTRCLCIVLTAAAYWCTWRLGSLVGG